MKRSHIICVVKVASAVLIALVSALLLAYSQGERPFRPEEWQSMWEDSLPTGRFPSGGDVRRAYMLPALLGRRLIRPGMSWRQVNRVLGYSNGGEKGIGDRFVENFWLARRPRLYQRVWLWLRFGTQEPIVSIEYEGDGAGPEGMDNMKVRRLTVSSW